MTKSRELDERQSRYVELNKRHYGEEVKFYCLMLSKQIKVKRYRVVKEPILNRFGYFFPKTNRFFTLDFSQITVYGLYLLSPFKNPTFPVSQKLLDVGRR